MPSLAPAAKRTRRRRLRVGTGAIGAVLFLIVAAAALFAPLLAPHNPITIQSSLRLLPPMWMEGGTADHFLGTDHLGRDIWSRLLYGSRMSLLVGISAVAVSGSIGAVLGIAAGFFGGWIDHIVMRVIDALLAIPTLLLILFVMAVLGPGLLTLIVVIGVTSWVSYARVMRAEVLSAKERDYVRAARSVGAGSARLIFKHILPNVLSSFVVIATMNVASTIMTEASLSFLGLGIKPPTVTWGGMLSDGRQYLASSWWVSTFPGLAITITVLSITFLGDWLRDKLDPRMGKGGGR
ncbi:ABC transporter permease [Paenibacillus hodogayensis]|uniref:ABC transporter permease n=1 Tax=Paenibacillus hodogayensis TaxID=279208 RepID=A0ABV5W6M6_9BACL